MSPESTEALLQYFEACYGSHILDDEALVEAMGSVLCRQYALGDFLEAGFLQAGYKAVLLVGRIRVLQTTENEKEETRFLLSSGDIWDQSLLELSGVSLLASSDALVCQVPSQVVVTNPVLKKHLDGVIQKQLMAVKPDIPESNGPRVLDAVQKSGELPMVVSSAKSQESAAPSVEMNSPAYCLEQALLYFDHPLPTRKVDDVQLKNLHDLGRLLSSYTFIAKEQRMNWHQLLNATYPLVLEDADQKYHWIVGRKGNTLVERLGEQEKRYSPDVMDPKATYNILLVKRPSRDKEKIEDPPYTIGWYFRLCMQNWVMSSQMVLAAVLIQIFNLGMPIFYMVIFDRVFGRSNLHALDIMALGIAMLMVFDFMVKTLRSYVLSHHMEFIDKATMEAFLARVLDISLSKASPQTSRAYAERFPELVRMNQTLVSTLLVTSLEVAFSVILVIFLLSLHLQLALISLASLVPIAILNFWTAPQTKKRAVEFNKDQRGCQVKLTEVLDNRETVQSLNAVNYLRWQIADKMEEFLHRGFLSRFDRVNGMNGQAFIASVGSIVTLYFGAHEVIQGTISYGIYMAMNMLSRQVIGSVQKLFASILQFQEAMATMEQFKKLYSQEVDAAIEDHRTGVYLHLVSGNIRFVDLSYRYDENAPWALRDINLEIFSGQKVVLTGKSGSGKTTLLRHLQRLCTPNSGYISLDGFNLADMDLDNLRKHVGVALQRPAIFGGSILDNIALGNPHATRKEILEAATMAQLDEVLLKLPEGLDTQIAPMGANLSGGQVGRIALARILLMKPSILILDEALAACDLTLNAQIFNHIFEKYKNNTCIFVTDFMPVHERADLIIVLNEGQVAETGQYDELVQRQGYYTHLHQRNMTAGR